MTEDKEESYREAYNKISVLLENDVPLVANLSNFVAILKSTFNFFWVGFYIKSDDETLHLGPFQGTVACTTIKKGKGVCGTTWVKNETILVPDVHQFEGHIACNADSKSEIVIPVLNSKGNFYGVLDVDSNKLNDFDATDQLWLEKSCAELSQYIKA